jgi:hypothetical protein
MVGYRIGIAPFPWLAASGVLSNSATNRSAKTWLFSSLLFIASSLPSPLATAGGLRGKVLNKLTKEPLDGSVITVSGQANYSTVTDKVGEYIISAILSGTYTVKATHQGFQPNDVAEVIGEQDSATYLNIELTTRDTQVVVNELPVFDLTKPAGLPKTNDVRFIDDSLIQELPFRNLTKVISLLPGVDERRGSLYFKGGLPDENRFTLDGADVTDVYAGGPGVIIPQEAVQLIEVQNGGSPAEYGGANGGIVMTNLKTGGQRLHASLQLETDNYTPQGKESLGGYSYGYSDYVATLSGPAISDNVRFFGAVENEFYRDPGALYGGNPTPMFRNGMNFKGLITYPPQYTLASPNSPVTDTLNLVYPAGNTMGGQYNKYSYVGTLLFNLGETRIRASGSYSNIFSQDGASIAEMFDTQRLPVNRYRNGFGSITLDRTLTPYITCELNVNYYTNYSETGFDPLFGSNFEAYGSPGSNPVLNSGLTTLIDAPWYIFGPTQGGGLSIYQPGTLLATNPAINSEIATGSRLDFIVGNLEIGGEYRYYTIRHYQPGDPIWMYRIVSDSMRTPERNVAALRSTGTNNFGYDVFGNRIDNDQMNGADITDFGPRHPASGAVYVRYEQNFSQVDVDLGLRYDYTNPDSWGFRDPQSVYRIDSLAAISASSLTKTPALSQVSPRIGLSFRASPATFLHAEYSRFIQEPEYDYSYSGMGLMYKTALGSYSPIVQGFGLMPERCTHYDLGVLQRVGDNGSLDITGFLRYYSDRPQSTLVNSGVGPDYYAIVNGTSAINKGIEAAVMLYGTRRLQIQLHYTYTNFDLSSSYIGNTSQNGYSANMPFPESHADENTASILLDYRFGKGDCAPVLERFGIEIVGLFRSGYPYALIMPIQAKIWDPHYHTYTQPSGYSSTPSTFEVDLRIDKTVTIATLETTFYIYVQNLLNAHNADNMFPDTNSPSDDGWLGSPLGQVVAAQYDPALYRNVYTATYLGNNSGNYKSPRQIRFGVRFDY